MLSSHREEWANGCPVVSFDCEYEPSEIIEDGKTCLLAPEGDTEALATAIACVLDDDALREGPAAGEMERVKLFSVKEIAPRWLA